MTLLYGPPSEDLNILYVEPYRVLHRVDPNSTIFKVIFTIGLTKK